MLTGKENAEQLLDGLVKLHIDDQKSGLSKTEKTVVVKKRNCLCCSPWHLMLMSNGGEAFVIIPQ